MFIGDFTGSEDALTDRLRLMLTERRAFAAILGRHGDPSFPIRAIRMAYEALKPALLLQKTAAEVEVPETFQFVFAGCTWLIGSWLASSDPIPAEQMAKKLLLLSNSVFDNTGNQTEGGREGSRAWDKPV